MLFKINMYRLRSERALEVRRKLRQLAVVVFLVGVSVVVSGLFIFAVVMANQEIHRRDRLLDDLSRIYPICSYCKKVRDDKGYWRIVEDYMQSHSEAQFSHSICPDCMAQLYPEVGRKKS